MASYTVAQLLKLKNRLASREAKARTEISAYNSTVVGSTVEVDVPALIVQQKALSGDLIRLKTLIATTNVGIYAYILEIQELKGQIDWYKRISTLHGPQPHERNYFGLDDEDNKSVVREATIRKKDVDEQVETWTNRIDELQELMDRFNHSTVVEFDLTPLS